MRHNSVIGDKDVLNILFIQKNRYVRYTINVLFAKMFILFKKLGPRKKTLKHLENSGALMHLFSA